MTETSRYETDRLTIPDLVELLDESLRRGRRLFDGDYLVGSPRDGVFAVPSVFLAEGRPLPALRGTIIVLHDAGFDPDETIDWLLTPEDTIGVAPIEALLAGRKSEVRRVAATLA